MRFGETFKNRIHVSLSLEACGMPAGTECGMNCTHCHGFFTPTNYGSVEDNRVGNSYCACQGARFPGCFS